MRTNGESNIQGPLQIIDIYYKANQTNLATVVNVPVAPEPANPIYTFTFQPQFVPTFSSGFIPASIRYIWTVIVSGKNTSAGNAVISVKSSINGSAYSAAQTITVATNVFWSFTNYVNPAVVGDTINVKVWADIAGVVIDCYAMPIGIRSMDFLGVGQSARICAPLTYDTMYFPTNFLTALNSGTWVLNSGQGYIIYPYFSFLGSAPTTTNITGGSSYYSPVMTPNLHAYDFGWSAQRSGQSLDVGSTTSRYIGVQYMPNRIMYSLVRNVPGFPAGVSPYFS